MRVGRSVSMEMQLWQAIIDGAGAGNLSRWVEDACRQKLDPSMLGTSVPEGFRQRLDKILERRGHGDISDLLREAVLSHIEREERRLGIDGNTHFYTSADTETTRKAAEGPPHAPESKPPKAVNYGEKKRTRKKRK